MEFTTTKAKVAESIIAYFAENPEVFNICIEQLDDYCGYLDENRFYRMDWFNDYFCDTDDPLELLTRAYYGEFNPNDDYFRINVYGNLESCSEWDLDYSWFNDRYAVEKMQEYRDDIPEISENPELEELFNMLDEPEEDPAEAVA